MKKKKKEKKITYRECRSIKRLDGLKMKTLKQYTFRAFLDAIVSRTGKLTAYSVFGEDKEKSISYNHLKYYSEAVSSFLLKNGLQKGDKVAIMGESCPNYVSRMHDCWYCGSSYSP